MKQFSHDFHEMDVSVIIVNFNTCELTKNAVKSVEDFVKSKFEIIVIDNGSSEDITPLVNLSKDKRIILIKNEDNLGFAKANNQGLRIAKGNYMLLLNSDAMLTKDGITELLEVFKSKKNVGAVVPKLLNKDGSTQASVFNEQSLSNVIKEHWLGQKGLLDKFTPNGSDILEVSNVVMAAFLISRETLKNVGFLDEGYFMFFEDLDYCRRIKKQGLSIFYVPSTAVYHFHGASGQHILKSNVQWRRLTPSSKRYHGTLKHYLFNFVIWSAQKVKALKKNSLALVFLFFVFLLYSFRLGQSPVHLNQDELMFALNGHSIAKSGHDWYGNMFPFYFWHLQSFWATPIIVYLTSAILLFLPLSEFSIRLASVFVTVFSTAVLMILVNSIFSNKKLTYLAGFLFVTTPALFINSRVLLDNIYPIPFVLLWLYLLHRFTIHKTNLSLFLAGLSLGIGIHSYHAAKIYMPVYLFFTFIFLIAEVKKKYKSYRYLVLGFLIPIFVFVPWLMKHPDTLLNQISYIGGLDSSVNVEKGIFGVFNLDRAGFFVNNYITYLSPKILFMEGDRSLIHSTGYVGAFLVPVAALMVFGVIQILLKQKDNFSKIVLAGLITYPFAPAIVNDPQRISRGLIVIPFMILTATYGACFLWQSTKKSLKVLLVGLMTLLIIQFSLFLVDYFGDYRSRSSAWFNNNIGGGMESVIENTRIRPVKFVYLDGYIPFIDLYANFYEIKRGVDSTPKVIFNFQQEDFRQYPPGSIVLVRYDHIKNPTDKLGLFEKIDSIKEPNGNETFYVYFRSQ